MGRWSPGIQIVARVTFQGKLFLACAGGNRALARRAFHRWRSAHLRTRRRTAAGRDLRHEAGLACCLEIRAPLLPGGFRGVRRGRRNCDLRPFLRTQDRATEVSGQWWAQLRRIGVAAREPEEPSGAGFAIGCESSLS